MRFFFLLLPIAAAGLLALVTRQGRAAPAPSSAELPPLPAAYIELALPTEIARVPDDAGANPAGAVSAVVAPVVETLISLGGSVSAAARRVFQLPAAAEPYRATIAAAEEKHGIPESLLARVLYQESRFRPEIINGSVSSPAGAQGIAQFMPATAAELGIDPLDPQQAIPAAGRYLRQLYDSLGDWAKALAAYNWGIGNVRRKGITQAPAETRQYISQILSDVEV